MEQESVSKVPNPGSLVDFEAQHPDLDRNQAQKLWEQDFSDHRIGLVQANVIDIGRLGVGERARMMMQQATSE